MKVTVTIRDTATDSGISEHAFTADLVEMVDYSGDQRTWVDAARLADRYTSILLVNRDAVIAVRVEPGG